MNIIFRGQYAPQQYCYTSVTVSKEPTDRELIECIKIALAKVQKLHPNIMSVEIVDK